VTLAGTRILRVMGILSAFRRDKRQAQNLNEIIPNTVPLQHLFAEGFKSVENLPVVKRCLNYIGDTINSCELELVDDQNRVLASGSDLPEWVIQPSGEYVFEELVHQAVTTLIMNGNLRLLASTRPDGTPMFAYVGTNALQTYTAGSGLLVYIDTPNYGDKSSVIVANRIAVRRRLALAGRPWGLGDYGPANTLVNAALHAQDVLVRFFGSNMFTDLMFQHEGEYVKNAGVGLIEQLAKRHAGPKNAFRPLITDRRWKVERLRESNQANQVVELMSLINTAICSQVFGIDPMVFSLQHGTQSSSDKSLTYQNAANLRSQVWQQACEPIAQLLAGCMSDFAPRGQHYRFRPDEMLRGSPSDRATLALNMAQVNAAVAEGSEEIFSRDEIRRVLGY